MPTKILRAAIAALTLFAAGSQALAGELRVEIAQGRSIDSYDQIVESAVRQHVNRLAQMSDQTRRLRRDNHVFTVPVRVVLTKNGQPLPVVKPVANGRESADIVPTFDLTGPRSFPTEYRTYLQSVFTSAKSAMDASFGTANVGGAVKVLNYDADIPARQAVAGGIYIPNAPGGPEIRFPIYQSATAAAINYVHTLLLAYMGPVQYPFDAYNEGIVRAVTMQVARSGGSIPNSTPDLIESTLDSLYDASSFYPYSNFAGLGAPQFIAPNLLNDPLPAGGSTGGIYLLRYQMAGTAFAKVLAEFPGFAAEYNSRFYNSPGSYTTSQDLEALGQAVIDFLSGAPNATVEGRSFSEWALRQHILDVRINAGLKLVPQAFPISPEPGTSDFGVFGIILNAFRTSTNGNETLLSGVSYPIYWRPNFDRFVLTAQDDVIGISGAYGSVVPNFPGDTFSGQPYRVAVDLPFQGKNVRLYLPAGAVATGSDPNPKNFYGTVVGVPAESGINFAVRVEWLGGGALNVALQNFAFGARITDPNFDTAQSVVVRLLRSDGVNVTEVFNRRVNKGKGPLALDLRSDGSDTSFVFAREPKLKSLGFPVDPYRPNPAGILSMSPNQVLVARWNPFFGRYDFFPDEGEFRQGLGYFFRGDTTSGVLVKGLTSEKTPLSVHLRPGWNLISMPAKTAVLTTDVMVTTTSQAVQTWADAAGSLVGDVFFRFDPDPVNPDLGTLVPSTVFEPGRAYFVRALKVDGAVLSFGNGGRSRGVAGESALRTRERVVAFRETRALRGGIVNGNWRNLLELRSDVGHACNIVIGQQVGASAGSGIEDVIMPAGPGGFQMIVINQGPFYRDLRPLSSTTQFNIHVNSLIPGQWYTLTAVHHIGARKLFVNGLSGRFVPLEPGKPIRFRASSTTMTFEVRS
ncbi:hypothetical protein QPK87_10360 [Kamptonema cortianum]|nr:hypothetical protein [Geitlerinema splendidum]MDK3156978.1 hypothetical protein [Kamptonema cortianum]